MKQIKKIIEKLGKDRLAILLIGGLLLLVVTIPTKKEDKQSVLYATKQNQSQSIQSKNGSDKSDYSGLEITASVLETYDLYSEYLESKLCSILQNMNGAGKVEVFITLHDAGSIIVEKDISYRRNNDSKNDGKTTTSSSEYEDKQETIYTVDENGNEVPFVAKQILPSIEGVLIVAQGGDNETVKNQMKEAVLSLFELDEHKITIVKMKSKTG